MGGSPGSVTCNVSTKECRLLVQAPAILTVMATTVSGIDLTTTVAVDSIPCPSGDPVIDSWEFRALVDSLWKLGGDQGSASTRQERTALLIDSAGHLVTRYLPPTSLSTPCSTLPAINDLNQFLPPNFIPGVMKVVASFHTHPLSPGDIAPNNCGSVGGKTAQSGPSAADWHSLYDAVDLNRYYYNYTSGDSLLADGFRSVVIEPERIWLMSEPSQWKIRLGRDGKEYQVPREVKVGTNVQGWDRIPPIDPRSCVERISTKPYFPSKPM